ncbi:MAG: hypothetical protein RSD01_04275 [Ruthenibacterium sp.]
MSICECIAAWLEQSASVQSGCPNGVAVGYAEAIPGCTVCDTGAEKTVTEITGTQSIEHTYAILLRYATVCAADRQAALRLCEEICNYCAWADANNLLPVLPAGLCAEGVICTGAQTKDNDDSGLCVYQLQLRLIFTRAAATERNY